MVGCLFWGFDYEPNAFDIRFQDKAGLGCLVKFGGLDDVGFEHPFHLSKRCVDFHMQRSITLALLGAFRTVQLKLKAHQAGEELIILFHLVNL